MFDGNNNKIKAIADIMLYELLITTSIFCMIYIKLIIIKAMVIALKDIDILVRGIKLVEISFFKCSEVYMHYR